MKRDLPLVRKEKRRCCRRSAYSFQPSIFFFLSENAKRTRRWREIRRSFVDTRFLARSCENGKIRSKDSPTKFYLNLPKRPSLPAHTFFRTRFIVAKARSAKRFLLEISAILRATLSQVHLRVYSLHSSTPYDSILIFLLSYHFFCVARRNISRKAHDK